MGVAKILYGGAQRALALATPLLGRGRSKLARGVRARRGAHRALAEWGSTERDRSRPTLWVHAPSVGEALQAEAVVRALRERRPGAQVAFTWFSPSAEAVGRAFPAEVAGTLPWDLPGVMGPALDALAPAAVAFTRTEVWPVLAEEAERRGLPLALLAAAVRPRSSRLRWPARALLGRTWGRLDLAGAVGEADAERLARLGVPPGAIRVTGDPRVDSAVARVEAARPDAPHMARLAQDPRPTLVAGSTWPADDRRLLPALDAVRERIPHLRVVLAPHEPEEAYVAALGARLGGAGWRWSRLGDLLERDAAEPADAVVVDSVGILPELYTAADIAYVGGGFGRAGLHSVLEPAAAGVPMVFGPRHRAQPSAAELLERGAAAVGADARELVRAIGDWLGHPPSREHAARAAGDYISAHRGAAGRSAALLDSLLTLA